MLKPTQILVLYSMIPNSTKVNQWVWKMFALCRAISARAEPLVTGLRV